jgi:uracil-DNA glycosylase family protein
MSDVGPAEHHQPGAEAWVPVRGGLPALRTAADHCRGCELWQHATQVVFSRGAATARIMLVGEQPGDQEDRTGEPFVGPAGRLLAEAVDAAGIPRRDLYLTNAVKHFRFQQRGKRRIHQKPGANHIVACRPWLEAELARVRPRVVVALGATAARSVLGRTVKIGAVRGRVLDERVGGAAVVVTAHPSALLRAPDAATREEGITALIADLRIAAKAIG